MNWGSLLAFDFHVTAPEFFWLVEPRLTIRGWNRLFDGLRSTDNDGTGACAIVVLHAPTLTRCPSLPAGTMVASVMQKL